MATSNTITERFWARVDRGGVSDCWLWRGQRMRTGYGRLFVGDDRAEGAHRVSYRIAHGEIPSTLHVLHHCDNKLCVNPHHLYAGTPLDNARDTHARGRIKNPRCNPGEKNGRARLSESDVARILSVEFKRGGLRHQDIAKELGVSTVTIRKILYGMTWRAVSGRSRACEA